MTHPWLDELKVALAAVRTAARICQQVQSTITPEVLDKKDNSPVTVADFASQAVIGHEINKAFPDDPIVAEEDSLALHQPENARFLHDIHQLIQNHYAVAAPEDICHWIDRGGAKQYSHRFWTLDPIDGTKGFLRRDQYAISLALLVDGQLELGILGCPNFCPADQTTDTLFYAIRGHGAFATSLEPQSPVRKIRVTGNSNPATVLFCESFESGHSSHNESALVAERLHVTTEPIRMDSQAKYATVASGLADIYLRLPTKTGYFEKIWDHAGGVLVVQEAGGTVSDMNGKPLDFSQGFELRENRGVIVTNGHLHQQVLEAVQAVASAKND